MYLISPRPRNTINIRRSIHVAIKALRPAFEALDNAHEQKDFEDVRYCPFQASWRLFAT